jgi:beta-N-acetylhexosaminidase
MRMIDWMATAGRTLMIGFPGLRPDPSCAERIRRLQPGGIILFSRNLDSPAQTMELLELLRTLLPAPPLLALDQEGGPVSRLEPFIGPTPSATVLAQAGEEAVSKFGAATASAMRSLGFNLDFAPVVDLSAPEAPNGIGERAYGTDPELVAGLAGRFLVALQDGGIAGCLKHFPGLGDTAVDSHVELPVVERSLERLREDDLLPYRLLQEGSAAVMVGHGHYPALNPQEALPASCSPEVVNGLLRSELGYLGLVVSDDMEMGAIEGWDRDGVGAVRAIAAGCDLVLYCSDLDRADAAAEALAARASGDPFFAERLRQAAERVIRTANRWPAGRPDPASWELARAAF